MSSTRHGFLRVGAACPRLVLADPEANARAHLRLARDLASRGVQLAVFPELGLTGYSCGDLFLSLGTLVTGAERALETLLRDTAALALVQVVGLPVRHNGRLYNGAAVLQAGRLLGVVAKTYLPSSLEYYEKRWFSSGMDVGEDSIRLANTVVPFGADLLFAGGGDAGFSFGVEICEDLWAPLPPSSSLAVHGATVILNPSASNDLVAKADYRRELVRQQSGRAVCAYVFASAGVLESTTDVVFGGHLLVAEYGSLVAEGERFSREDAFIATDVDVERLSVERARQTSFGDALRKAGPTPRRIPVAEIPAPDPPRLLRPIDPHPFVPADESRLAERCREVFAIQTAGLARRLEHAGAARAVLGLSGGLDSTLALLVCARAFDLLRRERPGILAVTMPGFGTTERTLKNAGRLAEAASVELRTIDIRPACERHISDIGLDPRDRESTTFENIQARERTQILMDLANKEGGLVVGTGDLSELALGFCTFGGDHMAMYNVNGGVPKTLVRRLVSWVAETQAGGAERMALRDVLATPVSPELLPPAADGSVGQETETIVGPYELHDFFLYCLVRLGAGPAKILFLASHAFLGRYDETALRHWLSVFIERFFALQFKRSVLPDGPKVGTVSLSPRGDWRMPSDATAAAWLRELVRP